VSVERRPLEIPVANLALECHAFVVTDWRGTPVNAAPEEHDFLEWFCPGDLAKLTLADPSYPTWLGPLLR
jgi:8-oxo-dGTP diphosphatase